MVGALGLGGEGEDEEDGGLRRDLEPGPGGLEAEAEEEGGGEPGIGRGSDVAYASNIAGVILGGLSENLALVIGFNALLLIALGYYALSLATSRKPTLAA